MTKLRNSHERTRRKPEKVRLEVHTNQVEDRGDQRVPQKRLVNF